MIFVSFIREVSIVAIDEHMNAYQPSASTKAKAQTNGEPIPVVYIPRKPHPNGFLVYLLATFLQHPIKTNRVIPYILDFIPHVQVGDIAPSKAFCSFLDRFVFKIYFKIFYRWKLPSKPTIIADAAFGTDEVKKKVQSWNGTATLSYAFDSPIWLWNTLKHNVPPNH